MLRLNSKIKEEIISLIKQGKSLNYISKRYGKGKTTIYYYMRKINGRKYKPIKLNLKNKELIGEIVGLFAGDGYYAHNEQKGEYRIKIYFNALEIPLIEYYRISFYNLTGKFPGVIHSGSVKIMQICSKIF